MNKIRTIIADDERHGRETLDMLIQRSCNEIEIIAKTDSVQSTIEAISSLKPDLVFLDIDFPDGNGFDVLYSLDNLHFEVIFVTAYSGYAIKAIKCSALDYLLKPIDSKEIIEAVEKARIKMLNPNTSVKQINILKEYTKTDSLKKLVVPSEDGYIFLDIENIIRCEAESNYTKFFLAGNHRVLVSKTLKEYDEILSHNNFFRVHKSHLINMNHIKKYLKGKGGFVIMSDGSEIEVSARKKVEFLEFLSKM